MKYIASDKIKVFPSIGRDSNIDADAELMNEGNISNIIRSLCRERKSYVLSKSFEAPFEFVIYGFYFKINDVSLLKTDNQPLYAHIKINDKETGNYQLLTLSNVTNTAETTKDHHVILDVGENSKEFQGVWFDENKEGGTYTLQLLDEKGNIPISSLLHTKTDEIIDNTSGKYISENFTTDNLRVTTSSNLSIDMTISVNIETNTLILTQPTISINNK